MIVTSANELPQLNEEVLVFDYETSSGHKKLSSVNPWHNCRVAGLGVGLQHADKAWYFPTGHMDGDSADGIANRSAGQLDEGIVAHWFYDTLKNCKTVIGQNIKYDVHVLVNNWQKYADFKTLILQKDWIDTLTHAKLVDSDRWSYSLANLSKDWLGDEKGSDELTPFLKTKGGRLSTMTLGRYLQMYVGGTA